MCEESSIEAMRGEYDPPYDFESVPTEEDIRKAEEIIKKYEKSAECFYKKADKM